MVKLWVAIVFLLSFLKGPLLFFWSLSITCLLFALSNLHFLLSGAIIVLCPFPGQVMLPWCLIIGPFLYFPLFLRCLRGCFLIRCIPFCLKTPFLICNLDLSETDPRSRICCFTPNVSSMHWIPGISFTTIMLDIRKAFDTVHHDKLLVKLWCAGVPGSVWMLFKSYRYDRRQCVRMDGHAVF